MAGMVLVESKFSRIATARILGESERLLLRKLTHDDREEFLECTQKSRELHRPWLYTPQTKVEFADYIGRFDGTHAVALLICHKESREIAGFFTINEIIRGPYQRASVGYGVFTPNERQGYMKEGFRLVVRFAFGKAGCGLRLHRLEADIQSENQASERLADRAGFKWEGESSAYIYINKKWTDHERYAITSERAIELELVKQDEVAYPPSLGESVASAGTHDPSNAEELVTA
ncbi:MAG: GNAT family N-acetyltransferase [Rhodospirillales bacterium]|nr:GNAT family N-acetyltransferase [Acetobacter sp.]